ncbi:MAG: acetyl/propionyl/methylcrotonyl-CoA carboxylase subunit alpha [Rickettsiales bacterium]|jgi:propionyl-CoA carboxylase alpha chain|nr:acetyl/propionyl/methylcrotonyl-CoA carboxylase subunit alpha [Rickettsiales bacterium]
MSKKFRKILVANRGEIACRIMRSVRKMGARGVAIYSEADANALHVKEADEAVFVGPSPTNQSYLNIDNILDAIRKTGAEAVHPGYGFLSENRAFAEALEKEGIVLIGPSPHAIKAMGDKIEAKKLAEKAGVNTVPGYMGVIKDAKEATKIAKKIGFPVMIKAAAGGGGKGMRVVYDEKAVEQAFSSATNEARNSFKDARIFIEKYIENPRHIEIQVIADKYGNIVCLGERECSIQRHHQKVIEEAPSVFIDDKTRKQMYKQVVSLAKKVGYYSAGTVEFIVDTKKNFYFLEMNTRLQVEHCVTEFVTGIDIVEQMIRIAAGEKLSFTQADITLEGWAIESRIYAEDPVRGFLPSSGRITEYKEPQASKTVRVDSGVYEGCEVSMFYDPMIAKLITYGQNRKEAISQMQSVLGSYVIRGISHNLSFLEALISHPRFGSGDISTNFIADEYPDGFSGAELTTLHSRIFLSTALHIYLTDAKRAAGISGQARGRERQIGTRWVVSLDNERFPVYTREAANGHDITFEGERLSIRTAWVLGNRLLQGTLDGEPFSVHVEYCPGGMWLGYGGRRVKATVRSPRVAELEKFMPAKEYADDAASLNAPISGKIVALKVQKGHQVKRGQPLLILEAMKMENIIYAEHDVLVSALLVQEGDNVNVGQQLMAFEPLPLAEAS